MFRDAWFWIAISYATIGLIERGWRKEIEASREYWKGETFRWLRECERLIAPVASAMRYGAPHYCHDARCDVDGLHRCHGPECQMRGQREAS